VIPVREVRGLVGGLAGPRGAVASEARERLRALEERYRRDARARAGARRS
jgi:hypothetical protein